MLQREGEHLGVEGSMLEIVIPVLELVLVSWALDRDSNTFFLHPDLLGTQVLSCHKCKHTKYAQIQIYSILNAFYLHKLS